MGIFRGPNIVTDGLVLALDAASKRSYPGTGTTWSDLSGNGYQATMSNMTAGNWVTYNGVKSFETNDTINQGFRITGFPFPQSGRTYEIWLNSKSYGIGWQTWFDDGGGERVLFGTSADTIHVYPSNNFTANLVAGEWYQILYTMNGGNGTTVVAYKNGVSVGTGTYGYDLATSGTLYILGDASSEITSCYCSIVRIYDRVLSTDEVLQNFNAQKSRYGL